MNTLVPTPNTPVGMNGPKTNLPVTQRFSLLLSFEAIDPQDYLFHIRNIVKSPPKWWSISDLDRAFLATLTDNHSVLNGAVLFTVDCTDLPDRLAVLDDLVSSIADMCSEKQFLIQLPGQDENGPKEILKIYCQKALGGTHDSVRHAMTNVKALEIPPLPSTQKPPSPKAPEDQLERVLDAAKKHGEDDDPDHEVGDLQDVLREAWSLLTREQRHKLLTGTAVSSVMEAAMFESNPFLSEFGDTQPSTEDLLRDCFAAGDEIAANPQAQVAIPRRQREHKFETTLKRWDLGTGNETPMANEPTYKAFFEVKGDQLWLDISPANSTFEEPLSPSIQLGVEINNGLPAVHIHTNSTEAVHLSLFGDTSGKVIIQRHPGGDTELTHHYQPSVEKVDAFFGAASEDASTSSDDAPRGS